MNNKFKYTVYVGLIGGILITILMPIINILGFYSISDIERYIPDKITDLLYGTQSLSPLVLVFALIQNIIIFALIGLIIDFYISKKNEHKKKR